MGRRLQVVVALLVGSFFGASASGCAFLWLGVARADGASGSVMSAPCSTAGTSGGQPATYAVLNLAGRSKEDLAANVLLVDDPSSPTPAVSGLTLYPANSVVGGIPLVGDGVVAVLCQPGAAAASFFVR